MEMEHINDNTIRVLLKSEDLMARGITFLDLLGNGKEIENFFYSILDEVDVDHEFKGNDAITFQVIPKPEGLELFISKNLSLEDMNPYEIYGDYFSQEEITKWLKTEDPERFDNLSQEEIVEGFQKEKSIEKEDEKEISTPVELQYVFELDSFETMIQLSTEICLENIRTNLYVMQDKYYLSVFFLEEMLTKHQIEDQLATVTEFANKSELTTDYLSEHGQLIMSEHAIELTREHFKF
ncbi:MAG TPA: adaptor protein MecA [Candidatus Tetragenococcus pullicola]|nr:adaptor protein MecA [Candidatus Tetragenococcus pullicola]